MVMPALAWLSSGQSVLAIRADVPAALRAFQEARETLAGEIEWVVEPEGDPDKALRFANRYARNGDFIYEVLGDKEGWTVFSPDTGKGWDRHPQRFLVNKVGGWYAAGGKLSCSLWRREENGRLPASFLLRELRDARGLGTYVASKSLQFGKSFSLLYGSDEDPIVEWSEDVDGPIHIVTGRTRRGITVTWYINAERGWNAERISYRAEQGEWEMVASLARWDGVWFPAETRFYNNGRLTERIAVTRAELDPTEAALAFDPGQIGVEPGAQVAVQNPQPGAGRGVRVWSGECVTSLAEFEKQLKVNPAKLGENVRKLWRGEYEDPYLTPAQKAEMRADSRARMIRRYLHPHETLWERYVRDFIKRYRLDDQQSQKAWLLLLECQRRADALIRRDRQKLVKLIDALLAASEAKDQQQIDRLSREFRRLRKPVADLFSKRLKPGLERLPTRAQRKQAEARARAAVGDTPDTTTPRNRQPD